MFIKTESNLFPRFLSLKARGVLYTRTKYYLLIGGTYTSPYLG